MHALKSMGETHLHGYCSDGLVIAVGNNENWNVFNTIGKKWSVLKIFLG